MAKFICRRCTWVYDEEKKETPFTDLPESFACTVCGSPKISFEPIVEKENTEEDTAPE